MSYYSIRVFPDENDLDGFGCVGGTLSSGIPALKVTQNLTIQFQPEDHEFAIRYLTKIADEARALAAKVAEANS